MGSLLIFLIYIMKFRWLVNRPERCRSPNNLQTYLQPRTQATKFVFYNSTLRLWIQSRVRYFLNLLKTLTFQWFYWNLYGFWMILIKFDEFFKDFFGFIIFKLGLLLIEKADWEGSRTPARSALVRKIFRGIFSGWLRTQPYSGAQRHGEKKF